MTNSERLKEIEANNSDNEVWAQTKSYKEIMWLINRVKRLTKALEHIQANCGCPKPEDCYDKAKEALETE